MYVKDLEAGRWSTFTVLLHIYTAMGWARSRGPNVVSSKQVLGGEGK